MFILAAFLLVPDSVAAQNLGLDLVGNAANTAGYAPATETSFATTLGRAIRVVLSFLGVVFTILTVYAGLLWMTARGNDTQVETAKKTLQNALIGLVIAVASYSITGFVMRAFQESTPVVENPDSTPSEEEE